MSRKSVRRRTCLALAAAPLFAAVGAQAQNVNLSGAELQALRLRPDGVTLDFPTLADTGFSIPLYAEIAAPAGLKVALIDVYLPENPNTRALRLRLPEPQSRYNFTTRLRLAGSQDVWVVVTLSDGSQRGAHAPTVVTSSACFDGT